MEKKLRHALILLLAAWSVIHLTGCTLVGLIGGSMIDASTPDTDVFAPSKVDSIECGRTITVLRTDSTTLSGECGGVTFQPDESYAAAYKQFRATYPMGGLVPALGDNVRIVTRSASHRGEVSGQLIGFSAVALRMQSTAYRVAQGVLLDFIDTVYHTRGSMISGETLRGYIADGKVPLIKTRLLVSRGQGTIHVPVDSILQVWSPNSHYKKWVGLGLGAAIDGAFILLMSDVGFGM